MPLDILIVLSYMLSLPDSSRKTPTEESNEHPCSFSLSSALGGLGKLLKTTRVEHPCSGPVVSIPADSLMSSCGQNKANEFRHSCQMTLLATLPCRHILTIFSSARKILFLMGYYAKRIVSKKTSSSYYITIN